MNCNFRITFYNTCSFDAEKNMRKVKAVNDFNDMGEIKHAYHNLMLNFSIYTRLY